MSTISDVAKLAGVSTMTVSRVVNNSGYIRQETRERVEKAIAEQPEVDDVYVYGIPAANGAPGEKDVVAAVVPVDVLVVVAVVSVPVRAASAASASSAAVALSMVMPRLAFTCWTTAAVISLFAAAARAAAAGCIGSSMIISPAPTI